MYQPYVRISTGNLFTALDNNPLNPVGAIYAPPPNQSLAQSTVGGGAPPVVKYVQYKSTTQPTPQAAPAPVYYTDESFTTVSGNAAEAFFTTGGACVAGYLLPNTTSVSTLTAAILQSCYCFIQIGGLLKGAYAPTTTTGAGTGSYITGLTTGNNTSLVNTTIAASSRVLGIQWSAIASSACDVLVGGLTTFWGS